MMENFSIVVVVGAFVILVLSWLLSIVVSGEITNFLGIVY